MRNNKTIFIFTLLLGTFTQGMHTNAVNLTHTATLSNGTYISPKGLVYTKGGTVKDRLDHLKQHIPSYIGLDMAKINKKPLHSFYNMNISEHDDIIEFIDTIYTKFQEKGFNFNITTIPSGTSATMNNNIVLHGKEYRVTVNNDQNSGNDQCRIFIDPIVPDPVTQGYPETGNRVNNTKTYGYKLVMNVAPSTSNLPNEVQAFFPY